MSSASMQTTAPMERAVSLTRWEVLGWVGVGIAAAVLYGQTAWGLVGTWWTNPDYSHGLLVPFLAAYIVHDKRKILLAEPWKPSSIGGLSLIAFSLALYMAGFLGAEFFLQRMSLVVLLAGIISYVAGWRILRLLGFPLVLLSLSIPLPSIVFNSVALPLQLVASSFAEWMLQFANVPVLREGNILLLSTQALNVAEACSGIRSLVSLLTLGTMLAYLLPHGIWLRTFFVSSAVPIAILFNALRVGGTGLLAHYYGSRAAEGFFHTFSGWLVFVAATGLLYVEMALLRKLRLRFGGH